MWSVCLRFAVYSLGAVALAAVSTPVAAEPVGVQEPLSFSSEKAAAPTIGPTIRPLFELDLDPRHDERREGHGRATGFAGRSTAPSGIIASFGRLGVAIDSSDSGRPRIRGLAWTPNRSLSVIAGGNVKNGGIGASLSLRFSF
jgi:hypothetical protein